MLFHVCKICGKEFATPKGLCGHLRIHSGKRIRSSSLSCMSEINEAARNFVLFSERAYGFKEPSFMTEIEQLELNEAATSLGMFSERVDFVTNLPTVMDLEQETIKNCGHETSTTCSDAIAMDLEQEKIKHCGHETSTSCSDVVFMGLEQERIIHCADSKQDLSDVAAQALPFPLRSKSQTRLSCECNICGKIIGSHHGLNGHRRVHRSKRGRFKSIKKNSEAKTVVLQPSCFEVSQDDLNELEFSELGGIAMEEEVIHCGRETSSTCSGAIAIVFEQERIIQCADSKQDLSHKTFSTCSDVVAQALPSPLRSKSQTNSSYECNICGKIFGCCQALNGHKNAHRSSTPKKDFEDGNSLFWSTDSGAKNVVQIDIPEHFSTWGQPVNTQAVHFRYTKDVPLVNEENNYAEWLSKIDPSSAPFHFESLSHLQAYRDVATPHHLLAEVENQLTKSYEMSLYKVKANVDLTRLKLKDAEVALKTQLAEKDSLIAYLKKKLETRSAELLVVNKKKESLQKKLAAEKKLWSEQLRLRDSQAEEVYKTLVELTKKFADRMDKVKKYLKDRAKVDSLELELISQATGILDCLKVLVEVGQITVPEDTMKTIETDILWFHAKLEGVSCEELTPNVLEVSPVPPFVRPSFAISGVDQFGSNDGLVSPRIATELRFDHIGEKTPLV